ncbi:hypothetical protein [Planctomyces sp. SH-PL62]|uniref:hypothetical protein n=1 Tax=Planctomyces sp. SH-PL62 TaxID=1636152 RepID=UPI00078BB213|nr:hypothetical protein [Planctomyces sp. SH-PL62]AMV38729.1 hypothetical protein VT85_14920 [Planctomyces sp. SH-PL62]
MKPMFVDVRHGEKDVHWLKFLVFSIALIVIAAAIGGVADFLILGFYGYTAPIIGATLAILVVVRLLIRIVGYQPIEVESDIQSS